jgi:allophanate hydrolase subunit 2
VLSAGPAPGHLPDRAAHRLPAELLPSYADSPTVEVILGPQANAFTDEGMATFLEGEYQVSPASNRMGYRLAGPAIAHQRSANIISDGVALGAIQVPADQQPILMMADRQTTGGYTKIAVCARADMPLLAQLPPGAGRVRFRAVDVAAAQQRYRKMMWALARW